MPEAGRRRKPKGPAVRFSGPGVSRRPPAAAEPGSAVTAFRLAAARRVRHAGGMETLLTVMGWVAVAILAWFTFDFVRNLVRSRQQTRERTDKVGKDLY